MNRHVMKAVCGLVAVLIWIQVASNHQVSREIDLPLRLEDLPQDASLYGESWQDEIHMHATSSEWNFFLHRYLGWNLGHVAVDLSAVEPGVSWTRELTANDVVGDLSRVVIDPAYRLELYIDRVDTLQVPVEVTTKGSLPSTRVLTKPITTKPETVLVWGPARRLTKIVGPFATQPLDLAEIGRPGVHMLEVLIPDDVLSYSHLEVEAVYESVEIQERIFVNVPVVPVAGTVIGEIDVSPPVISVVVAGPVDVLQGLTMSDISVTVQAKTEAERHGEQVPEVHLPTKIRLVGVDPDVVVLVPALERFDRAPSPPR